MRFADLLGLSLSALHQQKVRTALTTLGVVIGSFVLILSLSIGQGVQETATRELRRHDQLRKIRVHPGWKVEEADVPPEELQVRGVMSEARRERLRQALLRRWQGTSRRNTQRRLTAERVQEIAALPHVEAVVPSVGLSVQAQFDGQEQNVIALSATPEDEGYRDRVVAGDYLASPGGKDVLVSEYFLYRCGVADEADVDRALGRPLRLEYRPYRVGPGPLLYLLNLSPTRLTPHEERVMDAVVGRLPEALEKLDLPADDRGVLRSLLGRLPARSPRRTPERIAAEFTVRGVLRDATRDEQMRNWSGLDPDADVLLPTRAAAGLFDRVPDNRSNGYSQVVVRVDREENVRAVHEEIKAMGLQAYSLAEFVEQVRLNLMLISFATAFVALVALIVAGLGITNTMLMSVLERTREIGVMKAVGARDWHVQMIFLVEGTLIGAIGSGLGLLLAWAASFPGDRVAASLAEKQAQVRLDASLFVFPWWLVLGVPLFVSLLTMLAAVYPARRAARINPIAALRHE